MYTKMSDYFTALDILKRYPNRILFLPSLKPMERGIGTERQYNTLRCLMQELEENLLYANNMIYSGKANTAYIVHKVKWYQLPFNSFCWFRYTSTNTTHIAIIKSILKTSK